MEFVATIGDEGLHQLEDAVGPESFRYFVSKGGFTSILNHKSILGLTVTGRQIINKMTTIGFCPTQREDGEANFSCAWTAENIQRRENLLRIRLRASFSAARDCL